MAAYDGGGID
jgi:hypothetical protein